jgi:potassium channel subfamily K
MSQLKKLRKTSRRTNTRTSKRSRKSKSFLIRRMISVRRVAHDRYADRCSRWWFASTACPLIAGTFGPMANAFSICALVETWRVHIPPGLDEGHGERVEDPKWLIAVNSISLVLALAANMSLLLNMARRLNFAIAQPITILGWYLASALLIVLVVVASTSVFRIQPMQEHALSQAFYYGIIAAGLYFIIASLMVFTAFGAWKGHYSKDFQLTSSQRTLMLQTIGFMVYLLLGALVFCKVEGWQFLDAVFWVDFTLLTVGIGGEFVPKTHTGRSLLFPFAIGGLIMVGLVIGSVRSLILEHGKQKMSARFVEIKRQKVLSSIDHDTRTITLGPFEKIKFSQKGLSEVERRKQEFHVMRRVHELSERKRRYTALASSTVAALLLWLLGALVFTHSEKPQGYSYFVWLYFSYTSLLTIGYGDLVVLSNSGKAFFVFWSLLAVPTLTILISNMGDTIIKAFKDFTIWIGSFTVLPDENGLASALKVGMARMKKGKVWKDKALDHKDGPVTSEQRGLNRAAELIEEEELDEAEEAAEHGEFLERDIHLYHFILAKEIRQILSDMNLSPPRQYTYEEWTYYLRLLGQDEKDASGHRKPEDQHQHSKGDAPDIGTADDGADINWSWLGIRSPLMGNTNEPEWLLQRLTAKLEVEMSKMSSPSAHRRTEKPPISVADLKNKDGGTNGNDKGRMKKGTKIAEVRHQEHTS